MLKKEFNSMLPINSHNVDEVDMFRALIKAFSAKEYACALETHASKGFVYHNLRHNHHAPKERKCEIADVLFLFFSPDGRELRYTFMQNKRDSKTAYTPSAPLKKLKASPIQWDLLHYRCELTGNCGNGYPPNCLSSALLESAATYGVFVNDANGKNVDMVYVIASDLIPVTKIPIKGRSPRSYNVNSCYNTIQKVQNFCEMRGTCTLDMFELACRTMLVGTPVLREQRELIFPVLNWAAEIINDGEKDKKQEDLLNLVERWKALNSVDTIGVEKLSGGFSCDIVIIKAAQDIVFYTNDIAGNKAEFLKTALNVTNVRDYDGQELPTDDNAIYLFDEKVVTPDLSLAQKIVPYKNYYIVGEDETQGIYIKDFEI